MLIFCNNDSNFLKSKIIKTSLIKCTSLSFKDGQSEEQEGEDLAEVCLSQRPSRPSQTEPLQGNREVRWASGPHFTDGELGPQRTCTRTSLFGALCWAQGTEQKTKPKAARIPAGGKVAEGVCVQSPPAQVCETEASRQILRETFLEIYVLHWVYFNKSSMDHCLRKTKYPATRRNTVMIFIFISGLLHL